MNNSISNLILATGNDDARQRQREDDTRRREDDARQRSREDDARRREDDARRR